MLRFHIIDCFGDVIRKFNDKASAKLFLRNKPDCRLHDSIFDDYEECLL